MRTILLICFSLLGTLPTVYGQSSIEKDRDAFRREADRFLSAMPDGLQEQQTQAILQAIQGDTVPLTRIRASRNIPTPLPTDVNAIYITPALRLYTPVKKNQSPLPLLIYLHGGGWTFGSINRHGQCNRVGSRLSSGSRTSVSGRTGGLYTCRKIGSQKSFGMGQLTGTHFRRRRQFGRQLSFVRLSA